MTKTETKKMKAMLEAQARILRDEFSQQLKALNKKVDLNKSLANISASITAVKEAIVASNPPARELSNVLKEKLNRIHGGHFHGENKG
jgi:hypothetical protein